MHHGWWTLAAVACVILGQTLGVDWKGQNWALNCDFRNKDMKHVRMPDSGAQCGGLCARTAGCTHFTWSTYQRGTCWLKRGCVSKADAFDVAPLTACGVTRERRCNGQETHRPSPPSNGDHQITITNRCAQDVWVGLLGNNGHVSPHNGGFHLGRGASRAVNFPSRWGGRFWGRTNCRQTGSRFRCETGDCGGLQCAGRGGATPATLAEITFKGSSGLDFYDISLVDGYNLPMTFAPVERYPRGRCGTGGCKSDLLRSCPWALQKKNGAGKVIGCYSACSKFNTDAYCCRNAHNKPATCRPNVDWPRNHCGAAWSACPDAYCYAYDDKRGTFTCDKPGATTHYRVNFC